MSTLGDIAVAAASDLNDELTLILNQAALVAAWAGRDHRALAVLAELQDAALRCAGISSELLVATLRIQPPPKAKSYSGNSHAHSGH